MKLDAKHFKVKYYLKYMEQKDRMQQKTEEYYTMRSFIIVLYILCC
jgi:hypothetical protein